MLFGLSAVIAGIIVITASPANMHPGSTHAAVLVRGEVTSLACSEGVARVGSATWVNDNAKLDRLHLPIRGHLRIMNAATAVFTAAGSASTCRRPCPAPRADRARSGRGPTVPGASSGRAVASGAELLEEHLGEVDVVGPG